MCEWRGEGGRVRVGEREDGGGWTRKGCEEERDLMSERERDRQTEREREYMFMVVCTCVSGERGRRVGKGERGEGERWMRKERGVRKRES